VKYPSNSLVAQLGRVVELRFSDDEIVQGKLLAIDPDDQEDITYQVIRIVQAGTRSARGTTLGATVTAELHELEAWRLVE
jgi:hypothetical protein